MNFQRLSDSLQDHRKQILEQKEAIENGTEQVDPRHMYYLEGMLDEIDCQLEVFDYVIKSDVEMTLKLNEMLAKMRESKARKENNSCQ